MQYLKDDGLITPEVGSWNEEKYKLVQYYCELFATILSVLNDCT